MHTFSTVFSTVSHGHNLIRGLRPIAPVSALLNSPVDIMDINFCSIQYIFRMPGSETIYLRLQHCLSIVGFSKLAPMYRILAFYFGLCYEIFDVGSVVGNRDSLIKDGKTLR